MHPLYGTSFEAVSGDRLAKQIRYEQGLQGNTHFERDIFLVFKLRFWLDRLILASEPSELLALGVSFRVSDASADIIQTK